MTTNRTLHQRREAYVLGAALIVAAWPAFSQQYVQDSGRITRMYVSASGEEVGIELSGGFPNAIASKTCPAAYGYFAGNKTPSRNMVAALLSARVSGSKLVVTISGCEGPWFKISDVYIVD